MRPVPTAYDPVDEQRWATEAPKSAQRSAFARDRARVLHSAGWRRLAAKTQVMIAGEGDFPRTRLTHSLECAQVGRELGAALGCDPDLVETACLAHDLGHPPFGHNGEDALNLFCRDAGGFEGNAQTLRILTRLEAKAFGGPGGGPTRSVGLNLTRASLDAATKYPWPRRPGTRKFGVYDDDLAVFTWLRLAAPEGVRSFEAQVMDWADDVAYSVHDLEDGIHGGFIDPGALRDAEIVTQVEQAVTETYWPDGRGEQVTPAIERLLALPEWPASYAASLRDLAALKLLTSTLIGRFTAAAQVATRRAHGQEQLRRFGASLEVPDDIRMEVAVLKALALVLVMRRSGSALAYERQQQVIQELAEALCDRSPEALEPHLRPAWEAASSDASRVRVVADQVASLTDTSVIAWHARLCP